METLLAILVILAFISGAELFAVMLLAAALGGISLAAELGKDFDGQYYGMVVSMFSVGSQDQATILSTIPMFIYAGYLLAESKTADRLVRFANALVGWFPGGLAIVTIGTCALFTTFTGASGVTIVALGGVLLPALVKNGYPKKFSTGLLAGTGSVGLLFPPALPLFIYGTIYGLQLVGRPEATEWSTKRFLFAGIVPGIVLVGALSLVAVAVAWRLPRQKFDGRELGKSFLAALPELVIPFGVIAGLAVGLSPPEVASLTIVYVVLLELVVLRMIKLSTLWAVSREAMTMIGAIFVIILCSTVFTNYVVTADIPTMLVNWTSKHVDSALLFLLALNLLLLVVGMIMDIFSAIVIVLPLIVPIARHYGIDPYHLGVIFLLNLEVGYLTPPVGLNLFIASIKFRLPVVDVLRATTPFLITMIVVLGIVTYVPALTIVPPAERTDPVNNLVAIVKTGVVESAVTVTEITAVDHTGAQLKGADGKPITRKFGQCERVLDAAGNPLLDEKGGDILPDATMKQACQSPFLTITKCMPGGKSTDPVQLACANKAIAKWVAESYNEQYPANAVITVEQVTLADAEGKPLTYKAEQIGKDGKPVLDELGTPLTEDKPIAGPDGKPFTRTLEWCKQLETQGDRDRCRGLFITASSCKISPESVEEDAVESCLETRCPEEETSDEPAPTPPAAGSAAGSGSGAGSGSAAPPTPRDPAACKAAAAFDCCVIAKTKGWLEDEVNMGIARAPKLGKGGPQQLSEKAGGCSPGGAAAGLAISFVCLFLLMRRRPA